MQPPKSKRVNSSGFCSSTPVIIVQALWLQIWSTIPPYLAQTMVSCPSLSLRSTGQRQSEVSLRRSKRLLSNETKKIGNHFTPVTTRQLKDDDRLKIEANQLGRKRQQDQSHVRSSKRRRVTYKSTGQARVKESATVNNTQTLSAKPSNRPRRSSSRSRGTKEIFNRKSGKPDPLPSPCSTDSILQSRSQKRKRTATEEHMLELQQDQRLNKRQALESVEEQSNPNSYNPIGYWACNQIWPPDFQQRGFGMSDKLSSKRRSSSTHRSEIIERLAMHGISIIESRQLKQASRELCGSYLQGNRQVVTSSIFNSEEFARVLDRVRYLNEARIQRDITPWVIPSAENLFIRGELDIDWIGEELDAEWIRCATMGSTVPKPDFTFGLLRNAFTDEEIAKLENYATPTTPFHFTPRLSFPFLVCEAKAGEAGMNKADRQNIHSGGIAVNAIFELYRQAFGKTEPHRVQELYGDALVFTASHNHDQVFLYANFAIFNPQQPEKPTIHRYPIDFFSLSVGDGANKEKGYNFTVNVFEKFAVDHRKRIKDAVAHLPVPAQRTGLSFPASNLSIDLSGDQEDGANEPLTDGDKFKKPGEPSSVSRQKEMADLVRQMEHQRKDFAQREQAGKEREERLIAQMEQMQKLLERLADK